MTYKLAKTTQDADQHFSLVKLLLDGTDLLDKSIDTKAITVTGNAQVSTAQSKWNGSSLAFDGTGDYLSTPNSSDFAFGTGNFTVEMWVYSTGSTGGFVASDKNGIYWASLLSNNTLYWQSQNGSVNLISTDYTNYKNKWTHVAFVRNNGTTTMYLDGTSITSQGDSTNYTATSGNIDIGRDKDNNAYLTGYLQDIRITKGVARYTANFTLPTQPFLHV